MSGPIPEWLLTACVVVTVFMVIFSLGLGIVPGQIPLGLAKTGADSWLDLPRAAQIGVVLMAISPGAPVALRRSLGAGGHRAFAPSLQISVVMLAVVSMPL